MAIQKTFVFWQLQALPHQLVNDHRGCNAKANHVRERVQLLPQHGVRTYQPGRKPIEKVEHRCQNDKQPCQLEITIKRCHYRKASRNQVKQGDYVGQLFSNTFTCWHGAIIWG